MPAALIAPHFGYVASSFFAGKGDRPLVGHDLLAIDPVIFSNDRFPGRLLHLLATILSQPGTRLPGDRRWQNRQRAQASGVRIPAPLPNMATAMLGWANARPT